MAIEVKNLSYVYAPKTPYQKQALKDVSFEIQEGEFVGIIGATGSGKSTLIQHFNGLIRLTGGKVKIFDFDLTQKCDLKKLRGTVGMVFQYPEYQLFDQTVYADVSFGPKNLGLSEGEIDERVRSAIKKVGLDFEAVKDRSPFDLSGGQKRRVAIAGVLAMNPKVLVMDEPTAGLDPVGRKEIYELIDRIRVDTPTIIMISHNMDEISRHADRILVLADGELKYDETPDKLFSSVEKMEKVGLDAPTTVRIKDRLAERGICLKGDVVKPEDFVSAVVEEVKK